MKHLKNSVWLAIFLWLGGAHLHANNLLYFAEIQQFFEPNGKPYLELYLNVDGRTAAFLPGEGGGFSAAVDVKLDVVSQAGLNVYSRQFQLISPEVRDTSAESRGSFMDIRRISLDPGVYTLTGSLLDKNSANPEENRFEIQFQVDPQPNELCLSDLVLIEEFHAAQPGLAHAKHGYEIIPQVCNSSYVNRDSLRFYLEIYHADLAAQGIYFINTYLTQANSEEKLAGFQMMAKKTPQPFDLFVGGFDIANLPSSTYFLNVDLYNKENKKVANTQRKIFVFNSRVELAPVASGSPEGDYFAKMTEADFDKSIPTLLYIATPTEQSFFKTLRNYDEKLNFFRAFWEKRKKDPTDHPAKAWRQYEATVKYANQNYKSTHMEGWRTDRGRTLLTYGPPNEIERYPSDNIRFPYEVWRYNRLGTQADVIFVFYDPDMATNDYPLLHTNRLGGQNNPRWQIDLMRRTNWDGNLDHNSPGSDR